MKTILSLTATITLLGLISLAVAESKSTKPATRAKAAASSSSEKPAASAAPGKTAAVESAKVAAKAGATETPAPVKSASTKPKTRETKVPVAKQETSGSAKPAKTAEKPAAKNPLTPAQEDKLLVLLNEGTVEELDAIPGVATTRADSIISARPFASVHEIILVEGVGNATFEKILAHGKTLTQRPATVEIARKS